MKHSLTLIFFTAVFFTPFFRLVAQTNSYDGILLQPSSANNNTFYYGEPFHIYFRISNTQGSANYYYKPVDDVNCKVSLKNISIGAEVPNLRRHVLDDAMARQLQKMKTTKPSETEAYQAYESGYIPYHSGEHFGISKLSEKKFRHNLLVYMLRSIPVGEYEMTFEYTLYPRDKTIKAFYRFKVLEIPSNEDEAFKRYIQSTEYACKAHFTGDRNYSATHPDSYENFIQDYPNSIYSNHAYLNMVVHSYSNAQGGVAQADRIAKFQEYTTYFAKLKNNTLKMDYVSQLTRFISLIPGKDVKTELDRFLLKLKGENPEISDKLIRTASFHFKITGLTNYARGDNK